MWITLRVVRLEYERFTPMSCTALLRQAVQITVMWFATAVMSTAVADDLARTSKEIESSVDTYIASLGEPGGFSGAIALTRNGNILFAKGYGYANAEWKIPNSLSTRFRIGSITKQFTAVLIMQLQEQHKLRVANSICIYLTSCPKSWEPITLDHLLSHTSGLPEYTDTVDLIKQRAASPTHEAFIADLASKPLRSEPGKQYAYSNAGYQLLGMIAERVTGKTYDALLKEQIFGPLNMNDSGYDRSAVILEKRASGYRLNGSELVNAEYLDMDWPFAAGAMYSTVEDLLKWDAALYTDKLLPQSSLQTMWTAHAGSYGYGWMILPAHPITWNQRVVFHDGSINGFSARLTRFPDSRVAIVVLSNVGGASFSVEAITSKLAALVFRCSDGNCAAGPSR